MNAPLSWDHCRSFAAVLREGSLSGAARALGMTQPSIARHIALLEQALGTTLFLRTPAGLLPTEAALELRPQAEQMASTAAALLRLASGRAEALRGTVRITASEAVGILHLPPVLARLRRAHPGLVIELVLSSALDDLLRREADIAIRMVRPEQQALLARRVGAIEIGLHAHRDYLDRRGTPRGLAELGAHDLIGYDRETPALRAAVRRFPEFERGAFALRVDSDVAQLAAIRAGFGIGFCQVPVAAADPTLCRVLPEAFSLTLETWVVMHEDLRGHARFRAVFDALVEALAPLARS
ncbi:LysR family transcriptional regulator [Pseudoroseomonas cervicalis]|uniref:LysR family transcriptional regulator n=1 Tax=Teichococcus cervicalis TaxID=204525 RepID=UPI002786EE20|nr:LysR family transcriptional regulator [Pseudoroseomonas cervicalis]MDQ1078358.1 DNA-binding transcriptional LysR family regulator [Pseudoroseomonas cervicalis]